MTNRKNIKKNILIPKKKDFMITIYGLMAVIFVLIPEWIAEYGINLDNGQFKNTLPRKSIFDLNNPYLFIAGMSLKELRSMASQLNIWGYSSEDKKSLSKRIVNQIIKKNREKVII
tara:strand:- start:84 stop:431 length:348 start_codon:yes stop_codon:yes gene_type:complete